MRSPMRGGSVAPDARHRRRPARQDHPRTHPCRPRRPAHRRTHPTQPAAATGEHAGAIAAYERAIAISQEVGSSMNSIIAPPTVRTRNSKISASARPARAAGNRPLAGGAMGELPAWQSLGARRSLDSAALFLLAFGLVSLAEGSSRGEVWRAQVQGVGVVEELVARRSAKYVAPAAARLCCG